MLHSQILISKLIQIGLPLFFYLAGIQSVHGPDIRYVGILVNLLERGSSKRSTAARAEWDLLGS